MLNKLDVNNRLSFGVAAVLFLVVVACNHHEASNDSGKQLMSQSSSGLAATVYDVIKDNAATTNRTLA